MPFDSATMPPYQGGTFLLRLSLRKGGLPARMNIRSDGDSARLPVGRGQARDDNQGNDRVVVM
jgi:hypothetical protein